MKRILLSLVFLIAASVVVMSPDGCSALFSCGCNRDAQCLNIWYEPQCHFPPLISPCAVPCRGPFLQPQAVPMQFCTACPSIALPYSGVTYGQNPYPIFRLR